MRLRSALLTTAFTAGLALAVAGTAGAEEPVMMSAPPTTGGASLLSIYKYYVTPIGHFGEFPGWLVQLNCDTITAPAVGRECDDGFRTALLSPDGTVYPLLAGTDSVRRKIATRTPGAEVRVYGKFYANTNAILSSDLREVAVPGA